MAFKFVIIPARGFLRRFSLSLTFFESNIRPRCPGEARSVGSCLATYLQGKWKHEFAGRGTLGTLRMLLCRSLSVLYFIENAIIVCDFR